MVIHPNISPITGHHREVNAWHFQPHEDREHSYVGDTESPLCALQVTSGAFWEWPWEYVWGTQKLLPTGREKT